MIMKKLIFSFVCTLWFAGNFFAQAQTEDELVALLNNGKYKELVNKVCALREKEYYKNAFMDYCLAYGYCQLNEPSVSREWFDHILNSYNSLSTKKRAELIQLKQSCTSAHSSQSVSALLSFLQSMSTEGFEGNHAGIESKMGIPSLSDTVTELDFEHLTFDTQKRRFTLQQKKEALLYYQDLIAGSAMKADTTKHFLVFFPDNANTVTSQMLELEKYYAYYSSLFDLKESNRLITVFYCTSRDNFNYIAGQVHKIPVPKSTFGYASSIDLVMLGIANVAWLGAMKHELFHLMIRSFIGDIPAWLDEGTACYFESSTLKGDIVTTNLTRSNYRINLLYEGMSALKSEIAHYAGEEIKIPSIKEVTNFNWQEFSGKPGDKMIKASFNQSLSYAFVSYLMERSLLTKTMNAFRNRSFKETSPVNDTEDLTILHIHTTDDLIAGVTGMSTTQVQADFDKWCRAKNIYRN
jgi:hypothetical protein